MSTLETLDNSKVCCEGNVIECLLGTQDIFDLDWDTAVHIGIWQARVIRWDTVERKASKRKIGESE